MRNFRLDLLSLQDRRTITDEITLFKIQSGRLRTDLINLLHFNNPLKTTRHNSSAFYLRFVTTNVEYHSPILRMQRKHNESFSKLDLLEQNLNTFKRYATHEIKSNQ